MRTDSLTSISQAIPEGKTSLKVSKMANMKEIYKDCDVKISVKSPSSFLIEHEVEDGPIELLAFIGQIKEACNEALIPRDKAIEHFKSAYRHSPDSTSSIVEYCHRMIHSEFDFHKYFSEIKDLYSKAFEDDLDSTIASEENTDTQESKVSKKEIRDTFYKSLT